MPRTALVTGFGPFEAVRENPSGALARRLAAEPPAGWRIAAEELPVSFERAPAALDRLLAGLAAPPELLLGLGVHREEGYRLERRARGRPPAVTRPDVDGRSNFEVPAGEGTLASPLPLEALVETLAAEGLRVSEDAGGYVCERVYHRLLVHAGERGVPALFVHVPPLERAALAEQERTLRALFAALAARLSGASSDG